MNRKITEFLATYMQNIGINVANAKHIRSTHLIKIIAVGYNLLLLCSLSAFLIKNRDKYTNLVLGSAYTISAINIVTSYLYFLMTSKCIRMLLRNIDENVFVYSNEEKIAPTYSWFIKERNTLRFFQITLAYLGFLLISIIFSPFLAYCLTGRQQLKVEAIPIWLPFQSKVAIFLFQLSAESVLAAELYLKWIFPLFLHLEYERQCIRLYTALTTVEWRSLTAMQQRVAEFGASGSGGSDLLSLNQLSGLCKTDAYYRNAYCKIVRENLVQCIQHHQRLVQTHKLLRPWCVAFLSTQFVGYSILVGIMVYSFTQQMTLSDRLNLSLMIFSLVFDSFVVGYIGDNFSNIHCRIKDTLFYELNWYQQPAEIKQLLKIFHMLVAQKPFSLYTITDIEMGYRTFGNQCQYSYKYFNLLRRVI